MKMEKFVLRLVAPFLAVSMASANVDFVLTDAWIVVKLTSVSEWTCQNSHAKCESTGSFACLVRQVTTINGSTKIVKGHPNNLCLVELKHNSAEPVNSLLPEVYDAIDDFPE